VEGRSAEEHAGLEAGRRRVSSYGKRMCKSKARAHKSISIKRVMTRRHRKALLPLFSG
jgi:hypothetical protein